MWFSQRGPRSDETRLIWRWQSDKTASCRWWCHQIKSSLSQYYEIITCTRSGLLQERFPFGGGGGGGHSPLCPGPCCCFTNRESMRGGPPSPLGPYSSVSSSALLHFDMEELQDTDLIKDITVQTEFCVSILMYVLIS